MKKSLLVLMLGISFLFGNAQEASSLTGMELKKVCDYENNSNLRKLSCLLFIQGVVYGFQQGAMIGSDNDVNAEKKAICLPGDTSVDQWMAIVKKYLEDHPEKLHELGVNLIILSLATTFPSCYVEPDYVTQLEIDKSLDAPTDDDGY